MNEITIFHGGCHGCTQQIVQPEGVDFCYDCRYFNAEWDKPDLNNKGPSEVEMIRAEVISRKEPYTPIQTIWERLFK